MTNLSTTTNTTQTFYTNTTTLNGGNGSSSSSSSGNSNSYASSYALVNSSLLNTFNASNTNYNYKYNFEHALYMENDTSIFQPIFELGPKRDPLEIVIPVTIIYCLIFVTGVIGNISTCIVIKKNRSMHTATNYYLFSLAISDFLLLLSGVPQEMYFIWSKYPYVFGEYFCIGRGVLAETSANATVLTITAFTVERYMAICHPFLGQAMSKLSRAIRIIVLIWLVSVLMAIPQAAQFGIITVHGHESCTVVRNIIQHSFQLSTYIFFFVPMSIILVLYLLIGVRLHRSTMVGGAVSNFAARDSLNGSVGRGRGGSGGRASGGNDKGGANSGKGSGRLVFGSMARKGGSISDRMGMKGTQSDTMICRYMGGNQLSAVRGRMNQYGTRRVIKMLVAVVICFFLCWAPFHAQRLIAVYGINLMGGGSSSGSGGLDGSNGEGTGGSAADSVADDKNRHIMVFTVMTYVSGVLYYLSTCINPLLYNLMSKKFRQAFKSILFRKKYTSSVTYRRAQQSQNLRRTLTSSTQRESTDSETKLKHTMLETVFNERTTNSQILP